MRDGKAYRVRGKGCVLACYNSAIPYMVPELPTAQKEALGKSVRSGLAQLRKDLGGGLDLFEGIGAREFVVPLAPTGTVGLDRYVVSGQRSTFTCPHCKGQVTILRQKKPAQCSKCGRSFEGDWQYCPFDGTKRPASETRFPPRGMYM